MVFLVQLYCDSCELLQYSTGKLSQVTACPIFFFLNFRKQMSLGRVSLGPRVAW